MTKKLSPDIKALKDQDKHIHDWEIAPGGWGVVIGLSRCKKCGEVATAKDFSRGETAGVVKHMNIKPGSL